MEIQATSTSITTTINGVPVRLWEGVTANGIPCKLFIHRIAVANEHDATDFDRELQEQLPPTQAVPLSHITTSNNGGCHVSP